ncbi:uncharacterized protein LOC104582199 [Brachypodium distachyon]|uniref:F-box domain-containing protein n=1 Tax=Brachypodium distachyon TaxID=15368 RepID=I1GYV4_BRADI|nr:uncharacterized protein LOC104582199 [Brachypodium distachyon]KQK18517.1 hypothetical protein BRADI_1g43010v3 [Brachypodium distachyon]|eukprot:XP_010229865.1 uncharacterized protein LOC104582199 [Brachypodium distachyon]
MGDDLMLEILTLLPLKSAIRTAAVSKEWSRVWKLHLQEGGGAHPFVRRYHLVARIEPSPKQLLELLERRAGRRLHRFSLIVETSVMAASCFNSCLDQVAKCAVEDLHVELRNRTARNKFVFHFRWTSRFLARLSLRRTNVSQSVDYRTTVFSNLEVIRLYEVGIDDGVLIKMVSSCPVLRTPDLFYCNRLSDLTWFFLEKNLRTLTVVECAQVRELDVWPFFEQDCSIRSFRYRGPFLWIFYLPRLAVVFNDLCICYNDAIPPDVCSEWFDNTLFNTSELTVLTICSNTLQVVSYLTDAGVHAELAKVANFQKLKELQLITFEMKAVNLADIYAFLNNCHCPILESLFVQLPTEKSYDVIEELPEDVLENLPLLDAHNDVIEELPENVVENLKVVKITNSSSDPIAVLLVLFLLRKANSLSELLLVAPNGQLNVFDIPDIQQADRLLLDGALASGKLVLKLENTAPYPLHSDVFAEL